MSGAEREGVMTRIAQWLMGAIAGWAMPGTAVAQGRLDGWGCGAYPMWWMGGVWGLGMLLIALLFWGVVIAGVVLGIRWLVSQSRESRSDSALEILRHRYARGEIDRDEFESKKRDLA